MYDKQHIGLRESVLDQGFVELVDYLGDDDAPVDAARVSFAKQAQNYTKEQNDGLYRYLVAHNHTSPLEMVTLKFRVHAPVVTWWHWVRHRIGISFNFVSGRYVPFQEGQFYTPEQWRIQSKSNKQGSAEGEFLDPETGAIFDAARDKLYEQAFYLYDRMLAAGVAKEQARLVLPGFGLYYTAIVQMNARSLMNFLTLREDSHAQFEIREYASAIRRIVARTHPRLFGNK